MPPPLTARLEVSVHWSRVRVRVRVRFRVRVRVRVSPNPNLVEGCAGGRVEQQPAALAAPALATLAALAAAERRVGKRRVGVEYGGDRH